MMTQGQLLGLFPKEANIDRYRTAVGNKINTPTHNDTVLTQKHCELAIWALKIDLKNVRTGSPLWQHLTCLIFLMQEMKKAWQPLSAQLRKLTEMAQQLENELEEEKSAASAASGIHDVHIHANMVTLNDIHHNDNNNTQIHS